ncbi:MAG: hypothetical protein LUH22_03010 [Bacteroides sp.]|nr:hypothetical protein [Bacteroides sp.]
MGYPSHGYAPVIPPGLPKDFNVFKSSEHDCSLTLGATSIRLAAFIPGYIHPIFDFADRWFSLQIQASRLTIRIII